MIRINLLGLPRQKKGKRGSAAAAVPDMPGEGPSALIFLVAFEVSSTMVHVRGFFGLLVAMRRHMLLGIG